ncbi:MULTISPECIES: CDP-alcohol phosphatidyltransferase family protein [unclassified Nitratiruptor]|uniref:CDP-alcohol phosphatidyltransferase family protein n=1 Tax=unclassified Nitratiruptor TaxID=2624044 RepID=UPI0019151AEE|nr:CDP-diacylglycerol---glycerol-3-phosphate 3-phosphatidyltransferase [Nitratiruptor sp. YY08-10]BCD64502.1 CDP-diacylglycerol---glycerol-3-phosphate 3-phosphatidyltransferase [Nitratiruptor sp. YY08-14]
MIIKYTDILSYYVYQKLAYQLTLFISKTKITPNQITIVSLLLGIFAAISFYYECKLLSFLLLHLSFLFDCVDGQLARATKQFSKKGTFLDNISDRIVENGILLVFVYKYNLSPGSLLIFLNMLYSYIQDILIYSQVQFEKLSKREKIVFSPIYFLNRSFVILFLSMSLFYSKILLFLLFLYAFGIVFYFYRIFKW